MLKMMEAVRSEVSSPVFIWVNVMSVVMLASAFFMASQTVALLVFLSAIASVSLAYVLWRLTDNIYVMGSVHIPLWGPLLAYIVVSVLPMTDLSTLYGQWLLTASAVMTISLVFDVRDTWRVLRGTRALDS